MDLNKFAKPKTDLLKLVLPKNEDLQVRFHNRGRHFLFCETDDTMIISSVANSSSIKVFSSKWQKKIRSVIFQTIQTEKSLKK